MALRATMDVDLVANLEIHQADDLVRDLERYYYIDADMIRDAIHGRTSFKLFFLYFITDRIIYHGIAPEIL
jgi:hypothetical protein